MIVDFRTLFFFTGLTLLFYWLVPGRYIEARRYILLAASMVFLLTISVPATIILLLMTLYVYFASKKFSGGLREKVRYIVAGGVFIPLVLVEFIDQSLPKNAPAEAASLIGLGLAFYSLRAYSVLMDTLNRRVKPNFIDIMLLLSVFPTFGAGPIERVNAYLSENIKTRLSGPDIGFAFYRIAVSVFKVEVVLKAFLQNYRTETFGQWGAIPWESMSLWHIWICAIVSFTIIYVNFSAYSDLAVGLSRLFGIKVRENFEYPFLARNVQQFWRRWHMSLGNWLIEYIYTPLVRNTGRPYFAIFISFFIIGIWHSVTWNYLLWGAAHGTALAWINWSSRKVKKIPRIQYLQELIGYKIFMWFINLSFVASVSVFANERSFERGLIFLKALLF